VEESLVLLLSLLLERSQCVQLVRIRPPDDGNGISYSNYFLSFKPVDRPNEGIIGRIGVTSCREGNCGSRRFRGCAAAACMLAQTLWLDMA
jgi:hypothetical protein